MAWCSYTEYKIRAITLKTMGGGLVLPNCKGIDVFIDREWYVEAQRERPFMAQKK